MLKQLTEQYITAFDQKKIHAVANLLSDTVVLEDPVIKRLEGKSSVINFVTGLFNDCSTLSFSAKNIFVDGNTTIIEFILIIDDLELKGTDIIQWDGVLIAEIRAYLDVPKVS